MRTAIWFSACMLVAGVLTGCAPTQLLLVTQYPDGTPRAAEMAESIRKAFVAEHAFFQLTVFNMNAINRPSEIWKSERGHMAVLQIDSVKPHMVFVAGDD